MQNIVFKLQRIRSETSFYTSKRLYTSKKAKLKKAKLCLWRYHGPRENLGERSLRCKTIPLFTRVVFALESRRTSSCWERANFILMGLSTRIIFHWKGSYQGLNFSGEILHWGNLPEFLYKIRLMSFLLFADSILHVEILRVIVRSKFSPGVNCLENESAGRRDFSVAHKEILFR